MKESGVKELGGVLPTYLLFFCLECCMGRRRDVFFPFRFVCTK